MPSIRRFALRATVALLLVTLTIPAETLTPDPAAVAAAALAPTDRAGDRQPPAAPGIYRSASSAGTVPITSHAITKPAGVVANVTWSSPGQMLLVSPASVRNELHNAIELDVTGKSPWRDVAGRVVDGIVDGQPRTDDDYGGQIRQWSMAIQFEGDIIVWLAAANYLDPPGVLLPFGDELIVIYDQEVAERLGLGYLPRK